MIKQILDTLSNPIMVLSLIIFSGYLIGKINFFGFHLGGAGILLSALIFGHFGAEVSTSFRDLGLVLFVTAIGLTAGPGFFKNFIKNFKSYILLGILIVGIGAAACIAIISITNIPKDLAVGLFSGALTSTPGLAAAIEASGSETAAVGYGIAYPFGVVSVVLFVQLIPKLFHVDMQAKYPVTQEEKAKKEKERPFVIDKYGFGIFALTVALGIIIGKIKIPLSQNFDFSLGMSGGPLLAGIIVGSFSGVWKVSFKVPEKTVNILKEAGMAMFLAGAGTHAGAGFIDILKEHGMILFLCGALMTLLPMLIGFAVAYYLLKLNMKNSLGSICGGMTSTPALGVLVEETGSKDEITSYVATYPIALIAVVLFSRWIIRLMPWWKRQPYKSRAVFLYTKNVLSF